MRNTLPAVPMPAPHRRRSFLRLIVDRNPFFLISAVCMFAGVRVILAAVNVAPGDLRRLLLLIGVLNVYEAAVIALALYLITRRKQVRDGWILLSIEALFLVDLTFLNAEFFTANLRGGTVINALCWALTIVKIAVVIRTLKLRLTLSEWAYVALQLGAIFFMAGIFKEIARHGRQEGSLSALTLYGAWWLAGAMLVLATMLLRKPDERRDGSPLSLLPGRLYLLLPFFSLLVHLAGANRVYWVHFHPANTTPLLLGLAVLLTRWRGELGRRFITGSQCALAGLAVMISLSFPAELVFQSGAHAVSPLRLSMLASAGVLGFGFLQSWQILQAQIAAALLIAGLLGNTMAEMRGNALALAKLLYRGAARMVPQTLMQWGIIAVASAFVMLGLGAAVSLRKHPPGAAAEESPTA